MKPSLPVLALALTTVASSVHAQELAAPRFQAATVTPATPLELPAAPAPAPAVTERSAAKAAPAEAEARSSLKPILHAIGGAVIGGWVGYVGAQVVKSDWDKEENGSFSGQRSTWVAAGAAVGVLGSWLIGETRSPGPGPLEVQPRSVRDRSLITTQEIRDSGHRTALEVVTALRREWLLTRGTNSWDESARGTATGLGPTFQSTVQPGRDKIIVYMDDIRMGGVDELADVDAANVTSIRYLDGRQATYVYGSGHAHGAILISTEAEIP